MRDAPMDEVNMEPSETLEPLENLKVQTEQPALSRKPQMEKFLIPGSIALALILVVCIYFIFLTSSEKLIAQPISLNVTSGPATIVISVTNKEGGQATITELSPGYYKNKSADLFSKSISAAIEGKTLPLVINPDEVLTIKMIFYVDKKDLSTYCNSLPDSSHIVISHNGPIKDQLEGYIGLSWKAIDSEGNSYKNHTRLIYYVLTPGSESSTETATLAKSGFISTDPFELCTQEEEEETE
jgi:hypothetical protein